jgi:hypothetical protein
METVSRHLVAHGSIVLFAALVFGAPYSSAIKRNADPQVVNSWRVAHQSLTIGALVLFAVASVMSGLAIAPLVKWVIAVLLIISAYAFTLSTPLAAITRDRGISSGSKGLASFVYFGNIVGAVTSLVASAVLVFASLRSL